MKPVMDYTLYLVTDEALCSAPTLEKGVEQALKGGATLVQLREKETNSRDFYEQALKVKAVCDRYQVPLIINDRLDIALAVDAAGVHLGQEDLPCAAAKKVLGEDKIIGVTAKTLSQALEAEKAGADYLGCGAMHLSTAKPGALPMSLDTLRSILGAVKIPVVAIGGINAENAGEIVAAGVNGLAVVSAIIAAPDIKKAAEELKKIILRNDISG